MTDNPLRDTQTGGDHYKGMCIQPIVFATVNRYDPAAFSVVKYVSRHRRKNGKEDLQKAADFVAIRLQLLREEPELRFGPAAIEAITVKEYAESNQLSDLETAILVDLDVWVRRVLASTPDSTAAKFIAEKINHLSHLVYDEKPGVS